MKMINKVTEKSYVQWIETFVRHVLYTENLLYTVEEVIIEDIEFDKRILLNIDGEEYTILLEHGILNVTRQKSH